MLNIKNPETHRLATELARLTGQTLTDAVTSAVREKLATLQAEASKEARYQKLMRTASEISNRLPPEIKNLDIDELLYDPVTGLPK